MNPAAQNQAGAAAMKWMRSAAWAGFLLPVAGWAQFGMGDFAQTNTALQMIQTMPAQFPPELASRGFTEGEARVLILVEADGRLADTMLTGYSHVRFGKEALEALHQWRFVPARNRGVAVSVRTEVRFVFRASGQIVSVTGPDVLAHQVTSMHVRAGVIELVVGPEQVDEGLRLLKEVELPWPKEAGSRHREARATLDYYVDGEGRPQFITVVKSDGEVFNRAAMLALLRCYYVPPMRAGERVAVHTTREFVFQPPGKTPPPEKRP